LLAINVSVLSLNWNNIRSLDGAQHKGFEELCVQLARGVIPAGCRITRNGTPDGGVECYAVLEPGKEWGWQSKYVPTIEDSQWSQIDGSVKTALRTHPQLTRYHICLPLDLSDVRQGRRTSARDRWNRHIAKWNEWASKLQMTVEFVLWGSSELLDMLSLLSNAGRVMFWFGSPGCFDRHWFEAHVARVTKSAGPRYTPELHVELPISNKFDAFGRTTAMVDRVHETARGLQEKYRWISGWADCEEAPGLGVASQPLKASVNVLMTLLDRFAEQPAGSQGLTEICTAARQALDACSAVQQKLYEIDAHWRSVADAQAGSGQEDNRQRTEHRNQRHGSLREFEHELSTASRTFSDEEAFAEARVLVLTGEAGTGKTHLLCDLARQRVAEGRPTVLLLGQSFTTADSPARQIATALGFPNASLMDIVGCLEASAQAAKARCLILIDALNEGMGRHFWKSHLTEFLETIKASPWLAVALSVRTCYTKAVIPEVVLKEAAKTTHYGFEEIQVEAVKSFFLSHGLEFASVPVFSREFSNPLFLKTLCQGLQKTGHSMLPRGFHGITKVLGLYFEALEADLAKRLDYPEKQQLVRKAMVALVNEAAKTNQQFLSSERGREVIDAFLPGRTYSNSLYKALLDDGLIMESLSYVRDGAGQDVVSIAYERWADHLAAKSLLDAHLNPARPAEAFKKGGPLALYGEGYSMREGIREALSIQLPERVGREFLSLVPYGLQEWGMADAFLHSVIWRDPAACTPAMERLLNYIEAHELSYNTDIWDIRIMAATIPGHRLNMSAMDRWLWKTPMPVRDADWSIAIHKAWDEEHSICHVVDWAWRLERGAPLEEESAWLTALTLCWCFTSSHRFLRDRATKAAVNLLDDRLHLAARMVKHFAHVDDIYVWERVLAVACGVALRSYDVQNVTDLAEAVHETVFASGAPPAHILLRDYARCVIERAAHLGGTLTFHPNVASPPYQSTWPTIPTQEEIDKLKTEWKQTSKGSPDDEWALDALLYSVFDDDFARYVIGTNHGYTDWLSLGIGEPTWTPPSQEIEEIIDALPKKLQRRWKLIEKLNRSGEPSFEDYQALIFGRKVPSVMDKQLEARIRRKNERKRLHDALMTRLGESLSSDVRSVFKTLIQERDRPGGDRPPLFDLSITQRYIAKRVFDLGWTVDRFGLFDRHYVHNSGRDASKAERIGKKYQWISYHEISALIADHFQYRESRWGDERAEFYEGPWQDWFRDIDPTHGIKALPEPAKHPTAWWETVRYTNWENERNGQAWALDASDFPELPQILRVTDRKGVRWINAYGFYSWERKRPPSQGYEDAEKRSLWTNFHAWLVRRDEAQSLLDWAAGIDVGEVWMPHQLSHDSSVFLGEHSWARASRFHEHPYYGHDGWHPPGDSPVKAFSIPVEYLEERSTFDCSMDESFTLKLPAPELVRELGLRWSGKGADFVTPGGELFSTDPSAHEAGPHCLLLREDLLWNYLDQNGLSVVWSVSGEKNRYGSKRSYEDFFGLRFSGALELANDCFRGAVCHQDQKFRRQSNQERQFRPLTL